MNITKTIAAEVAEKLLSKQALALEALRKEAGEAFTKIYLKTLPKEVVAAFEKYPAYFQTRSGFQLNGNGFNWQSITASKKLPYSANAFSPTATEAAILLKVVNAADTKKFEYKKLFSEIETALYGLRTYKRVEENFPEAFVFLPNSVSTKLSVNISDLRNKIK